VQVLIQGLQHLNRAMHDDIVCVEMFPEERWVAPSSLVLHDEGVAGDVAEENEEDVVSGASTLPNQNQTQTVGVHIADVSYFIRPGNALDEEASLRGTTVYLCEKSTSRMNNDNLKVTQLTCRQTPREICAVWVPMYHWKRDTGDCGDKETETEVLLLEHDVPHQPFSQAVLACLPPPTFSITAEKDQAGREDLRALSICSVDPPGCTDIDDALHCKPLDNGNAEVGVHIADVSYFIRPGNALDEEASLRGTTVYLCKKVRCGFLLATISSVLRPADFILSFLTLAWAWIRRGHCVIARTPWFTRGVFIVSPQASLTYAEAQVMMDDAGRKDPVTSSLRGLNSLAKILKQRRIQNGALTLASPEVRFHMDSETHDPIDLQTKELK
uniref:RNB domain-containing protein n=1 Tax=Petromyzon marinus TaxID=7757 RepID=S4R8Y7_PETMA